MSLGTDSFREQPLWLFSRRADFWLAGGGASVGLLAAMLLIRVHGDRELDGLDLVLSELHLGATCGAVMQRRLWKHRQVDVVLVPLVILVLTYALAMNGQTMLLTSIAMYAAVWHRGRQSLGVARFYQHQVGGPVSRAHDLLFRGAIYLPMLAAVLAYTYLAPTEYENKSYLALNFGGKTTSIVGLTAVTWVTAYLAWVYWQSRYRRLDNVNEKAWLAVHPGEWWVVLANTVAFGSGYALGSSNASYVLVLAVHHEVQYLYFTYAMARRPTKHHRGAPGIDPALKAPESKTSAKTGSTFQTELEYAGSFLVWPIIGFVGAVVGGWSALEWLAPLGMGGLFCHYWLDGRIWTRRSFGN